MNHQSNESESIIIIINRSIVIRSCRLVITRFNEPGFILSLLQQVSDHDAEVWRQRRWPAAIARSVVAGSLCIMLSIGIYFRIIAPTRSGRLLAVQQSDI
jgi:hypothetical protein